MYIFFLMLLPDILLDSSSLSASSWLHPCSPSHFLATSHVGSSEQSSASPRVRDQSETPISPTTTTVDAAGQREGSGLTSCHTDPASQGQNPGPWATVSHCVSFQPSHSHGGLLERGRERWRGIEPPQAEGSFCDVNNDLRAGKPCCCCCLGLLLAQSTNWFNKN